MARQYSPRRKQVTPAEPAHAEPILADPDGGNTNPDLSLGYEEIARMAYSFWEARGYQGGSPEEDWFRAEQELRSKPRTQEREKSSLQGRA